MFRAPVAPIVSEKDTVKQEHTGRTRMKPPLSYNFGDSQQESAPKKPEKKIITPVPVRKKQQAGHKPSRQQPQTQPDKQTLEEINRIVIEVDSIKKNQEQIAKIKASIRLIDLAAQRIEKKYRQDVSNMEEEQCEREKMSVSKTKREMRSIGQKTLKGMPTHEQDTSGEEDDDDEKEEWAGEGDQQ